MGSISFFGGDGALRHSTSSPSPQQAPHLNLTDSTDNYLFGEIRVRVVAAINGDKELQLNKIQNQNSRVPSMNQQGRTKKSSPRTES
ncbi:hypothetical protein DsansV1_C24g0180541 [Dioscorea sansibarensis]